MIKMLVKIFGCLIFAFICNGYCYAQKDPQLLIRFNVTANGKPLVMADSTYHNAFGELFQVTRLKYYISNISLDDSHCTPLHNKVYLLETGITDSLMTSVSGTRLTSISFMLGVDSALNCSGAQDGALDPLNGMFWTWNSGYIFFKLEGYSPSSTADMQRIEHHVGGYRYPNNVAKSIRLILPAPLALEKNGRHIININVDLDKYWKAVNEIKIASQALLMTPGGLALKAAENFQSMFSITSVQ